MYNALLTYFQNVRNRKRGRCGDCQGCTEQEDCGTCINCKDKPGRKKQCCVKRKCKYKPSHPINFNLFIFKQAHNLLKEQKQMTLLHFPWNLETQLPSRR